MPFYFILLSFYLNICAPHQTKLSLCTISFEEDSATALVSFRLFTDDLASTMQSPLLKQPSDTQYDDKIIAYINKTFQIKINQQVRTLHFFTRSANEEVFELSFLITDIEPIKELFINNSMLTEKFEKQKNVVKIIIAEKEKRFILDKKETTINFENIF